MEGDRSFCRCGSWNPEISIHSLRMEGDFPCFPIVDGKRDFNPLPPHGGRLPPVFCPDRPPHFNPLPPHGGRHNKLVVAVVGQGFQSTPSAWRETVSSYRITQSPVPFQSTPSAWRETSISQHIHIRFHISIHSLRMEGD